LTGKILQMPQKSKKKICYIVFEPRFSGQGRAVIDLFEAFHTDCDILLVCQHSNSELIKRSKQYNVTVYPASITKIPGSDLFRTVAFLKKESPHLLHLHGFESLIWGHLCAALSGIPMIFTPHTIDMRNKFILRIVNKVWHILSPFSKHIITVSFEDKKTLIARGITSARKITPILLSVKTEKFRKISDPEYATLPPVHKPWIVQVGHLSYQKDPLCFIEIAKTILSREPGKAFFLLAGTGPMETHLKQAIHHSPHGQSIFIPGHRIDILGIMKHARCIVCASRWEGMPFSLIDACFLGKPVVASSVNGIKDLIVHKESGMLCAPGDVPSFSDSILKILSDNSFGETLGTNARKRAHHLFSSQNMGEKHRSVYEKFLPENTGCV